MAHVNFDGLNLRVTLDRTQRRAVHRKEFVVPRAHLDWVVNAPDLWQLVRPRISVLGLGYPGTVLWGTAANRDGQDFCLIDGPGPGLVIGLRDDAYERVLLSMPVAEAWPLYARLREVVGAPVGEGPSGGERR